jgi:AraC family transcriptional regulator
MEKSRIEINTVLRPKNMVSKSCIRLVEKCLQDFDGIEITEIRLGTIKLNYNPKKINPIQIELALKELGFPVIKDADQLMIEQIKLAVIELIHFAYNANSLIRNSDYLSEKLGLPYSKLSRIYSEKCNITLEKFIILVKIEKVKELLTYREFTLSEISYMMGYSSVNYLSNQFKQVTGITVSDFKEHPDGKRIPLDELGKC